jgi:hypothetical protein
MAIDPSVVVNIAAQWTGDKAFKKADRATDKLSKNVKHLGQALGLALSAGAMLSFAKASVRAAAEDEKAQKQLALALQNVGLGRDVAASEAYISKLSKEFGVVDDQLRPAYQTLAVATKDTAESQKLLQLSLDISASTGKDLSVVSSALSKAYLGNNTALSKLGVGISKADLKAGKFDDLMNQLAKTFNGAASKGANTFSGKMARLSVSIDNAKEIIGKGLIDSFMILTDSTGIEDLQTKIETFATSASENFKKLAKFIKRNETLLISIAAILAATFVSTKIVLGIAALVKAIETLVAAFKILRTTAFVTAAAEMFALNPIGGAFMVAGMIAFIAASVKGFELLTDKANAAADATSRAGNYPSSGFPGSDEGYKGLEKYLKTLKVVTAETKKQLENARLKLAIDKANFALGKGSSVFDLEKIQLAAAEKNQAEQLGQVTNSAQLLQITNDLARLRVKEDIANLEDAIAAKDIKAIEAGTAKLNKDLSILGALTGQEIKLRDIESIIKDLVPKDLINLSNLDAAIAKLKAIGDTKIIVPIGIPQPDPNAPSAPLTPMQINKKLAEGSFVPVEVGSGYSSTAGAYASSGFPGSDKGYGNSVVVNVSAGTIANPDDLTTLIQNSLISLNKRGDLTSTAGSL